MTSSSAGGATPFLVLSNCKEICDASSPLILLGGQVCGDHSRQSTDADQVAPAVVETWTDLVSLAKAAAYVNDLAESWLPGVANALNKIHGQKHSVRYWRILLGHWLRFYLGALYDRHVRLQQAFESHPGATTLLLSQDSQIVPRSLHHFHNLLKGDSYNFQLYSQLLRAMGRKFPNAAVAVDWGEPSSNSPPNNLGTRIRSVISMAGRRSMFAPRVVLRSTMAPARFQCCLALRTMGNHWPIITANWSSQPRKVNREARSSLATSLPVRTEFERLAANLLGEGMPQTLIEGHAEAETLAAREFPRRVDIIVSANAWHTDEFFTHWAAAQAEKGARLIAVQHGGNYGSSAEVPFEEHERRICDRYLTWGWDDDIPNPLIRPGPAWKLFRYQKRKSCLREGGILYVATHAYRHPFLLTPFEVRFAEYLEWQARFDRALPAVVRPAMRVRLHAEDYGWDIAQRWRSRDPKVKFESWLVPFRKSLDSTAIFICDHLSTTFLEALYSNVPTILFWDPILNPLRIGAQSYYDDLRTAGILCDSPEQAAETLAAAYADISFWWLRPTRQAARERFCRRFARSSSDPVREWRRLIHQG